MLCNYFHKRKKKSTSVPATLLLLLNNSLTDSSPNNFSVSNNAGGSFSTTAKEGTHSYNTSSGGYAQVTNSQNNPLFDLASDFTIEAWLYPTSTPSATSYWCGRTIWGLGFDSNDIEYGCGLTSLTTATFYTGHRAASNNIVTTFSFASAATLNSWNHIAIVRKNGVIKAYLNGIASGNTLAIASSLASNVGFFTVGGIFKNQTSSYIFPGLIDCFKLYNGKAMYTENFTPS
jgi:Concanavalin A-like lectin/glucanases superfamily